MAVSSVQGPSCQLMHISTRRRATIENVSVVSAKHFSSLSGWWEASYCSNDDPGKELTIAKSANYVLGITRRVNILLALDPCVHESRVKRGGGPRENRCQECGWKYSRILMGFFRTAKNEGH